MTRSARQGAVANVDWIDTTFDVRRDARGKDPDVTSPTLRRYHQLLWSKPLPNGAPFDLDTKQSYLHHGSVLGEFWLSSDSVIATFLNWTRMTPITGQLTAAEKNSFTDLGYTVGGMMVFPAQRVGTALTINGARGFTRQISDRMDLTLECIRRHYRGEDSPLAPTLQRYSDFFALFDDFAGYVDFFLLDDLVTPDRLSVDFFMPFDDFRTPAVPGDVTTYREFRRASMSFVRARNRRINERWGQGGAVLSAPSTSRTARGHERVVMGRVRHRR